MPECVPAPPDRDPLCGDGMPVGGELCHELSPPQINVGTFANDVWAGDLDGDMDADALALVDFPAEMAVLLNDGTGALMLDGSYAVIPGADTGAERVAVGDMNNDGSVDAVVAVSSPPSLRVMLGDGLGGFGAPIIAMLGQAPLAIDVGDIDGDGNLDAVLSDALSLSVLYGLGNGSFGMGLGIASPALTDGRALGIADFDDDGQLDVAVGFSQTVAVFLADGMGGLDAPWTLAVPVSGFGPQDLAIGDVNADMVPDILVADEQQNEIHELSGVGDGTFMLQPTVRDGSFVELGEGNSDCELDIYSRTFPSMLDELTIYPSDGMGGHLGAQTFLLGSGMVDMTTADFDGDGLSDVLFGIGPIGTVAVSFNQP